MSKKPIQVYFLQELSIEISIVIFIYHVKIYTWIEYLEDVSCKLL
jgi:hypothetical protein